MLVQIMMQIMMQETMLVQMMMQTMGDVGVHDTSCGRYFVNRSNEHEW
jgi:hypothetical protein